MATPGNWGLLYDALRQANLIPQTSDDTQFQFVSTPTVAAWSTEDQNYWADYWANFPPAQLGPDYLRAVSTVSDGFYDFINSLQYSQPETDPTYQRLVDEQRTLTSRLSRTNTDSVAAYKAWMSNGGQQIFPEIKTYTDWLASGPAGGQEYRSQVDALQVQLDQVNLHLIPFQKGSDKAISLAIQRADPSRRIAAMVPGSGGLTKQVYPQSISPDLGSLLTKWLAGQGNTVSVTLRHDADYSGEWHIQGAASGELFYGFFGFMGEAGAKYDRWVEADEHFSSEVTIQAATTFGLTRGDWFTGSMLSQYPEGPWAGKTADQYFGPHGSLKLVPSQLLVTFGVEVTLTLSQSTMERVHQQFEQASGIVIGPFFLGSETTHVSEVTTHSDGSQSITFTSTDNNPYVTGVVSQSFFHQGEEAQLARFRAAGASVRRTPPDISQFQLAGASADKLWSEVHGPTFNQMLKKAGWQEAPNAHILKRLRERGPHIGINTPSDFAREVRQGWNEPNPGGGMRRMLNIQTDKGRRPFVVYRNDIAPGLFITLTF